MMIAVLILSKCDFLSFNVWRWRALAGDEVVGHHHVRDACVVAAAISVVGFSSFGWTLGSTAERMAKERAQTAVVGVLAPIASRNSSIRRMRRRNWWSSTGFPHGTADRSSRRAAGQRCREAILRTRPLLVPAPNSLAAASRASNGDSSEGTGWIRERFMTLPANSLYSIRL